MPKDILYICFNYLYTMSVFTYYQSIFILIIIFTCNLFHYRLLPLIGIHMFSYFILPKT